ncbi:MAG: MBL fold metallo-hydrolase, partial [Candidatus Heimdallarchaeota archaeon]|nr:MBL fold metallo-hydrolase [Candidatus Heimdallarchaeota archaeon]
SFSFASTLLSPPEPFEIILYYLLLWSVFNINKKLALSTTLIIPLIFISSKTFEILSERSDQNLRVTFLSVGQGESTFIEFPNGKNMLIDGGGSYDNTFDIGKMVLRPYLLYKDVKEIDYLVLSHPHADHMNGLIHILKEFEIGEVWTTDEQAIDDNHKSFKDLIRKKEINKKIIHESSMDLVINGVHIEFLHPPANFEKGRSSGSKINNRSIVMRIKYGEKAFLLTGDLEVEGENEIIRDGDIMRAHVIKAGHHGSLSSSSPNFIQKVSPQYTVFTVGYKNRFHFPRDEVVKRYKEMGTETFRTDLDGAITFTTNGEALQVATFR